MRDGRCEGREADTMTNITAANVFGKPAVVCLMGACITVAAATSSQAEAAQPQVGAPLTILYYFKDRHGTPYNASADVAFGADGVLYGTTNYGGGSNAGTVYSLTPPGSPCGAWTEAMLYSFTGGSDGGHPVAGLLIGSNGALYGTASAGGSSAGACGEQGGCGTAFELTPPSSPGGAWTETVLHTFTGTPDGAYPSTALVPGSGGVLYGTTPSGGAFGGATLGYGTVFALTPPSSPDGTWVETVLYSFTGGSDGGYPNIPVIDASGAIYGTTYFGTAFELAPPPSQGGTWTFTLLYTFKGGSTPEAGLTIGPGGELYGTTFGGGGGSCFLGAATGCGTVFELTPPASPGGAWTETLLGVFQAPHADGKFPNSRVVLD